MPNVDKSIICLKEKEKNMGKVLGYRNGKSFKTGKAFCEIYVASEIKPADAEHGWNGMRIDRVYAPENQLDYMRPEFVGKELTCEYNINGRSAWLERISVK